MTDKTEILDTLADMGLTVESTFVPFSRSRNKDEKHPSLNWRVKVLHNGREVLTTDYSAGYGHCPAKAGKAPSSYRAKDRCLPEGRTYPGTSSRFRAPTESERLSDYLAEWRAAECETGLAMEYSPFASDGFKPKRVREKGEMPARAVPILPDPADVFFSLAMESSVLDSGGFENWASEYGYDTDSRKAESVYRVCLDLALALRGAVGDAGMARLQEAFQDY